MATTYHTSSDGPASKQKGAGRGFRTCQDLIEGIRQEKAERLKDLNKLQSAYRQVVGKEDPHVAEKIRETETRYNAKLTALESMHARFIQIMAPSDLEISIGSSNERIDFESDSAYQETGDESVRHRIRSRTLDESAYFEAVFGPLQEPEPVARQECEEASGPSQEPGTESMEEEEEVVKVPVRLVILRMLPINERSDFLEFAAEKPHIRKALAQDDISESEAKEVLHEYAAYRKHNRALVLEQVRSTAALLGVQLFQARKYIEHYDEGQFQEFALVAYRENISISKLIDLDIHLMDDQEYAGPDRMKNVIALCMFRSEMQSIIEAELAKYPRVKTQGKSGSSLTRLWEEIFRKHKGNLELVKAEYAERSAKLMTSAPDEVSDGEYQFGANQAFELFKLFNYDLGMLEDFQDYFTLNFSLAPKKEWRDKSKYTPSRARIPGDVNTVLTDFVAEYAEIVVLNERSKYYTIAKRAQDRELFGAEEEPDEPQEREEISLYDDKYAKEFARSGGPQGTGRN